MKKIQPIKLEWNQWNGFTFCILGIEWERFENDLFSINIGSDFFIVDICFISFDIKLPFL